MACIWTEPELMLEHNGMSVYHTYKNEMMGSGRYEYHYTTDITENISFDIRDLPSYRKNIDHSDILRIAIDRYEIFPDFNEMRFEDNMTCIAKENETSDDNRLYKCIEAHYLIIKNGSVSGCTGKWSTKESVLKVYPNASFKKVTGICSVCKKNMASASEK